VAAFSDPLKFAQNEQGGHLHKEMNKEEGKMEVERGAHPEKGGDKERSECGSPQEERQLTVLKRGGLVGSGRSQFFGNHRPSESLRTPATLKVGRVKQKNLQIGPRH